MNDAWLTTARWRVPPGDEAEFVFHLEDVLDVYARPADPARPVVCLDERVGDGGVNCLMAFAPRLGWRHVAIGERGDARDWALAMQALVEGHFPDAERIAIVLDNRAAHDPASFYKAFPPAEALRIREKIDLHFTPKAAARLNLAEWELSVLARQLLARTFSNQASLAAVVAAWVDERNAARVAIDWRFTIDDARAKLARLYPILPAAP